MEGALRLMDVAPDNLDAWLAAQETAEAKRIKAEARNTPRVANVASAMGSKPAVQGGVQ